jgi:hypothetical protein
MSTLNAERRNSENRLRDEDRPAHDWFRFVLSYPPHLVREYLERFRVRPRHRVLDPFCGTGTTLVECKKLGIPSVGVEANPPLGLFARTKVNWSVNADGLTMHARAVASAAQKQLECQGISDKMDLPLFDPEEKGESELRLRELAEGTRRLLITGSISPLPLHRALTLLESLENYVDRQYYDHERVAFAKAVVYQASNLHFGPEVGVSRKKKVDAPVVSAWLSCVNRIADDIRDLSRRAEVESVVHTADSRDLSEVLEPGSIDFVITSPPYPNEKDYTRTTRLESVLLGFVSNRRELQTLKKALVRSNTRGVYKDDDDDRYIADSVEIQRIAGEIEKRRKSLGKTSGFERLYARLTKL